jgi:hypothetical protein
MQFWFRRRRISPVNDHIDSILPLANIPPRIHDEEEASRRLIIMATNHMFAFVVIFYLLYAICRFGFGWDAVRDPKPPSYTLHIPGITD